MNISLLILIVWTRLVFVASLQDFTGSYNFDNCSCTVLRCLSPSSYQLNQSQNGDVIVRYLTQRAASGKAVSMDNGKRTQLSIRWEPGMDFDTNCTGLWIPEKRFVDLKCGGLNQYCTARLQCLDKSGPCAISTSAAGHRQSISWSSNVFLSVVFVWMSQKFSR